MNLGPNIDTTINKIACTTNGRKLNSASYTLFKGDLDGLVRDLTPPFFVLGNFNGRHSWWDEGGSNPRGVSIASFIEDEGLEEVFNKVRRIAKKYSAPSPPVLSAGRTVADPVTNLFAE
ncbi:hypothetical protein E2C01_049792 [Portunus trituberculatus]|uniref:Endonuclease/exonuclease/phosphatase domain-containing protein n=1 Tax=Portunus trituberculatus TaxID=210409 RepID=A0A5B7GES1_PORTR|nr:hypothetical protein [Portunus trituberculatus]